MALDATSFSKLPLGAKIGVLVGIIVLLSVLFYFVLYMRVSNAMGETDSKYEVLRKDLRVAEEHRKEYVALRDELVLREALDQQNLRSLPERAEIPAFLQDLNRVAELSGLKILLVEPLPEEQSEHYTRVPVSLRLSGRFHQLAKFFYHIGKLERAINMENIRLGDPVSTQDEVILKVSVLATTFRRLDAEAAASAPSAPQGGAK
ncbi:MAG: type 4a pilus biogenesis protein PilO [Myxococcales bacterium]|nr:type 4a pilus biogenesis protein PilO [Myxococcales bacterium]MCB9708737.1 type 4a pilus biogenesis protein PilO [Myxococcales bacterium]